INYTVAQNQDLTVNLEAGECIDHNIYQDMGDMICAVEWSIEAHNKVDKIKNMMKQDQYADETSQSQLSQWLEMAQKEADYYDDNLSKMYSEQLGICDNYLEDVNISITKMGCKGDQLSMTKTRMSNQQETVTELQSTNDDMDLSNIILRYTAAYTAYQSSLTAAGRLGQQTLLNYI
nr:flagellar hook-associated protein 3 [Lachnospiraceae bacterium]